MSVPIASDDGTGGVLIRLRVVPGASCDEVVGRHGDRLKVRVTAPPEGGKANDAVCLVIAKWLGVKSGAVTMISGHGSREKIVLVHGLSADHVTAEL